MEQQALILRSILAQLESQENAEEGAPNGIAGEFARLKNQSIKYRTDKTYSTKTAEKQENIKKNRYKDIVPFDHTRVKLTLTTSKKDSDYINASFIKGVSGSRAYIATQGPLPHTVVDFLRMIWEYNVKVIVMSCREFEMGKKKCEVYWPQKDEEDMFVCEPFTVHCDSEEGKGDYLTRTLRLTYRNCSRTLKQLHYVNWPDHGVPDTIPPILDMLHEMRCYQPHDDIPICIHCSAGCGRTGALCVIDYTWNLLRNQTISSDFNIYNLVQDMRTQRPSVVQTKEQYLLVYRTIRELFRRYLQTMETQNYHEEVTMAQSAVAAMTEYDLSDQSEDLDLSPQHHDLFEEERGYLHDYFSSMAEASEDQTVFRYEDTQWGQQQYNPFYDTGEVLNATQRLQEEPNGSPKLLHNNHAAFTVSESVPNRETIAVEDSTTITVVPEAVCLMVEDPYFDTPMSSPSSEEVLLDPAENSNWTCSPLFNTPSLLLNNQTIEPSSLVSVPTDDESPPPLPERTPESFVLAEEAELSDPCERLSIIFPPNSAAAEPTRELQGSPPSPAPPLPERTPESFELAVDPVVVEPQLKVPITMNPGVIGLSSEWSGTLKPEEALHQDKTFVRSKSLRANMNFSASITQLDPTNVHNYCPPVAPLTPSHLSNTEESLASPLAKRAPESFPFPAEEAHERNMLRPHSMGSTQRLSRVGMSSEWDGSSQPKKFLDVVMNRSKSVRAKSSKSEPLTAFPQLTPLPVVAAEGGSEQVQQQNMNHKSPPNTDRSGNKADKSSEKGMLRTKSLKLFRHKPRPQTAPPPPPTQAGAAPPSHGGLSVFKFGFGNRFRKPKGPRSYPETWI
ncbi:PREDICTED: tyrosine-protein phosphatase non-receptor type 12-like isoform X1 [Cyprinodon variegatus]|uniref:protein-tyrosine-phosphatase n=1 Tax=Cyprinodon variegatus TaxID=28743 RepID=A0A3Q2D1C6_CYPVA|nr:PREDICTED: tyrosine-protein phosphatase non-receptor type 12-like isoform X1 [Cyprinodon variegatus]